MICYRDQDMICARDKIFQVINLNNVSKYIVSMMLTLFLKCVDLGRNLTHFDYIFFNYYNNKATQDWCMYT